MNIQLPPVPLWLYTPADVLSANAAWGASCGPGALAALLGEPVMFLRPLFPRPWTTPTVMQQALIAKLGAQAVAVHQVPEAGTLDRRIRRGLLFIQLRGRWDRAPVRVQYQHTHWVAFERAGPSARDLFIYDVNAGTAQVRGGWAAAYQWETETLQGICADHAGASGDWFIRTVLEVRAGGAAARAPNGGCT